MNPALALIEFSSVAVGIAAGDAMVKRSPLGDIVAGTVQPGRYLVLVAGDTASVEEALAAGRDADEGGTIVDQVFLPDVHPTVVAAVRGTRVPGPVEALGVIETDSVAATLEAADAGVKGADIDLLEVNLADGLGGKAYALFGGMVSDVEAAVAIGAGRVAAEHLVGTSVIPQLHDEMGANLTRHPRFGVVVGREEDDAAR